MGAKGIVIAEECHVVNIKPPIDINGAGVASDVFSMGNYAHATIIIQLGVTGAATTITVEECDDFTPTTHTEIAFSYYAETTAAGDTLGARTTLTATTGFAASTNDSIMYVIEVDASQLTDGYNKLRVSATDPSAATLFSAVAILSGARYASTESATAIA